ncbi:hypothetical protein [Micromonospora sp. WMMD998]|uniref:hypothetical protein n=1 Tax=Micromonospora sp. WMMD998 TaxID=3016092 RepID=UPI00249B3078|nr:hypothetical protein [Micromonospora sp. WMMD998]WFE37731.1 hypothetical protein O7619_04485 [Micromonospora sp. WMMD998]
MTAAVTAAIVTAACGSAPEIADQPSGDAIPQSPAPYLPDTLLTAPRKPPQSALVVSGNRTVMRRIAVDWAARGGPKASPPRHVDWPAVRLAESTRRVVVEFDTAQLPSRAVLYRYPEVGANGIPDEADGTETICGLAEPDATCSRTGGGAQPARVDVAADAGAGPYWVVHAAWPVLGSRGPGPDVPVVSASWVIRVDR